MLLTLVVYTNHSVILSIFGWRSAINRKLLAKLFHFYVHDRFNGGIPCLAICAEAFQHIYNKITNKAE